MTVVNFLEYKNRKEIEEKRNQEVIVTLEKCKEATKSDDFNYNFLHLVDLFTETLDPLYRVKFDEFLERIERGGKAI